MLVIGGYIIIFASVLGGYVAAGGHLHALVQPFEFVIIIGAAFGAFLVTNTGKVSKDVTVLVRSDETAELRYALQAMDVCRKHGLNKIRLQTR